MNIAFSPVATPVLQLMPVAASGASVRETMAGNVLCRTWPLFSFPYPAPRDQRYPSLSLMTRRFAPGAWIYFSGHLSYRLATNRPDDADRKDKDNPDRTGNPEPAPRDPDGGVRPSRRRSSDDDGLSWGGDGAEDGLGGGGSNEPI